MNLRTILKAGIRKTTLCCIWTQYISLYIIQLHDFKLTVIINLEQQVRFVESTYPTCFSKVWYWIWNNSMWAPCPNSPRLIDFCKWMSISRLFLKITSSDIEDVYNFSMSDHLFWRCKEVDQCFFLQKNCDRPRYKYGPE